MEKEKTVEPATPEELKAVFDLITGYSIQETANSEFSKEKTLIEKIVENIM